MGERYANCTVSHEMHSDRRFDLLAELGGWTRNDACWRMVQLWARCTALQTDRPPADEIRIHLGLRGEQLLVDASLGERQAHGPIRVLGGGLTGGDVDRFGWYHPLSERNSAGGRARAAQAQRGARGRFTTSDVTSQRPEADQPTTSEVVDSPATFGAPPASGFRIPEEDQSSLSLAILPTPVPAPPAVPPGESAWHRRQRWWGAMLEADQRIRAAGIQPNAPSLPKAPAGENELNMNRCERQLLDGGDSTAEVDTKMRHIVAVAEAEAIAKRHRRYFLPALIWDPKRAIRAVDTALEDARTDPPRSASNFAGKPATTRSTAPAPRRGETKPLVVVSKAELAESARIAAAANTLPNYGVTDGARAPPASATAITDEQQPEPAREPA